MSAIKRYFEEKYGPNVDDWPDWPGWGLAMRANHPTERPNFVIIHLPSCQLAFSYETLIGVAYGGRWYIAKNTWGPTTGKHLNYLDANHVTDRLPQSEIESLAYDVVTGRTQALLTDLTTAHDAAVKAIQG